ncbi:MAG: mechanosensitive ion channel family protein [Dissulfurimicrobium sp.]|uniref:mechanosensitive ion channel family protein n=1 Tax=Dissulfurimicrobium sp. TaxID=2022436 RepID=UPI00404B82EC
MKVRIFSVLLFVVFFCFYGFSPVLAGQDETFSPSQAIDALNSIGHRLSSGLFDLKGLDEVTKDVALIREKGDQCVEGAQEDLDQIIDALNTIGPPSQGEPTRVADQRRSLVRRKAFFEGRLAECRIVIIRANELIPRIASERSKLLARRLLYKRPDIKTLFSEDIGDIAQTLTVGRKAFLKDSGISRITAGYLMILGVLCLIGLVLGLWARRILKARVTSCAVSGVCGAAMRSALSTFAHYLPAIVPVFIFAMSFGFLTGDFRAHSYLMVVSYALFAYFCIRIVTCLFLDPSRPATPLIILEPNNIGRSISRRINFLLILSLPIASLLFAPELQGVSQNLYELLDRMLFSLAAFGFLWIIWPLSRIHGFGKMAMGIRNFVALLVICLFAIDLLGYCNLAFFILRGIAGSLILLGLLRFIRRWGHDGFVGLSEGLRPWQISLRENLGIRKGEVFPGLIWLRFMIDIAIWSMAGLLLLLVWGVTGFGYVRVSSLLLEGFEAGSIKIVPFRILLGGFVFFILWLSFRLIKVKIEKKWLPNLEIVSDAGDGLITIIRYAGFVMAAVIALSIAGVDMSNLAIIAGALSVGVGFGLQNIVNNFVSGLILIFEKPIKKGDWIVAGGTEGHVKRIGVRSTVVRTFDNADTIIPNSELISNQVTNWMLDERSGRVRINIGIAYGSDTALVKRLLLDVVHAHPDVIKDGSLPPPKVWFMEFGDSSLNFQLNFYIKNINDRFDVRSDIMFDIDRLFRENGIEIPFPQRDIHIRDWPGFPA